MLTHLSFALLRLALGLADLSGPAPAESPEPGLPDASTNALGVIIDGG